MQSSRSFSQQLYYISAEKQPERDQWERERRQNQTEHSTIIRFRQTAESAVFLPLLPIPVIAQASINDSLGMPHVLRSLDRCVWLSRPSPLTYLRVQRVCEQASRLMAVSISCFSARRSMYVFHTYRVTPTECGKHQSEGPRRKAHSFTVVSFPLREGFLKTWRARNQAFQKSS